MKTLGSNDAQLIGRAQAQTRLLIDKLQGRARTDLDADDDFFAITCWRLLELTAATAQVTPDLQGRFPDVPWRELLGLRRRLLDGQPRFDRDVLWLILIQDLPQLAAALQAILADKPEPSSLSADQLREAIRTKGDRHV